MSDRVVLVCGGRDYADRERVRQVLLEGHLRERIGLLVHGGADGADRLADEWARANCVHVAEVRALWSHLGKAAGPIRNGVMLLLRPDVVVAFPGGHGTADMVRQARAAGVRVVEVRP